MNVSMLFGFPLHDQFLSDEAGFACDFLPRFGVSR